MSCLRCSARLLTKSVCSKGSSLSAPFLQQIRGIKPRWLPKSKSKIFYVRKPTLSDPEENKELQTMYNHYRTSVRAVRRFIYEENILLKKLAVEKKTTQEDLDADFQRMEMETLTWNKRVGAIREEWQDLEAKKRAERVRKSIEIKQNKELHQLQLAEEKIKRDIEESQTFVTMENLEVEIEKVLSMRSDYDFAVDMQGNRTEDVNVADRGTEKDMVTSKQPQATQV